MMTIYLTIFKLMTRMTILTKLSFQKTTCLRRSEHFSNRNLLLLPYDKNKQARYDNMPRLDYLAHLTTAASASACKFFVKTTALSTIFTVICHFLLVLFIALLSRSSSQVYSQNQYSHFNSIGVLRCNTKSMSYK